MTVLSLPRARDTFLTVVMPLLVAAFLLVLFVRGAGRSANGFNLIALILIALLLTIGMRWWRMHASDDAYVPQIWLTRDGIGLERDADRFSTVRALERWANPFLMFAPVLLALASSGGWNVRMMGPTVAFAVVMGIAIGLTRWRPRSVRAPRPDSIAPAMLRWPKLRSVEVVERSGGTVTVAVKSLGFVQVRDEIRFSGTGSMAAALRLAIDDVARQKNV